MKNKILVSIILFSLSVCSVQASQCVVDPRYEFVSIVWRLVGVNEYNKCQIPAYCEAIDSYFEPYKSDTLLMHCVQIRRKHRIAYDAIASATAVLEIKHNRIKVIDGFSVDSIATIDKRWTPEAFKEYVRLLDKFYRKSKFNKFFVSQRPLYAAAEAAADSIIFGRDVDLTWFKKFFGQELSSYKVFLSINNGYCNYGGLKEPGVNVAALLGGCYLKEGVLSYNDRVAEILTHEFMHAFANPLAVKYKTGFDTITDKIYPFVAPMLQIGRASCRDRVLRLV